MEITCEAHRPGVAMNRCDLPDRDRGKTQAGLPRVLAACCPRGCADPKSADRCATGCRTSLRAGASATSIGTGEPQ